MELIKVKNEGYQHYEDLLIRRDQLRKEAKFIQRAYLREFGDLITEVFEQKVDCIQKKKTISFCQAAINAGKPVDPEDLMRYLAEQMKSYQETLSKMVEENQEAQSMGGSLSPAQLSKLKKLYHKLAKQLHPDLNPKTAETPELLALWQGIVSAYNSNQLEDMEEADVLVQAALKKLELGNMEIEIPDLEAKIEKVQEEILEIKTTNPYCYKFLLEDQEAVDKKKQELQKELEEYVHYGEELDEIIKMVMPKGEESGPWIMS